MKKILSLSLLTLLLASCQSQVTTEPTEDNNAEVAAQMQENEMMAELDDDTDEYMDEEDAETEMENDDADDMKASTTEVTSDLTVSVDAEVSVATESTTYTLADVAKHNSQSDCWTVIDGKVADVTSFFGKHPGGDRDLAKACGKDASAMFSSVKDHDPKGYAMFETFVIGTLK